MGITKLIKNKNDFISYEATLQDVLDAMIKFKTKHMVLIKEQKPLAIITERDILFLYTKHTNLNEKAIDYANKELISSKKNRSLDYILGLMINHHIRRVIITALDDTYEGTILQEHLIYEFEQDVYKSHLKVTDIIKKTNIAIHVNIDDSLQNSLETMTNKNIGSILVYEKNKPVGILTESDIVNLAQKHINTDDKIKDYMHSPLICFKTTDLLFNIVEKMKKENIRRAVVLDESENKYYVVTSKDILNNVKGSYSLYLESKLKDTKDTLDSLNDAVIEIFDNKEDQLIHWFNKKAKKLFRLKIDDSITSIIPKDTWTKLFKKIKKQNLGVKELVELYGQSYSLNVIKSKFFDTIVYKLLFTNITEIVNSNKEIQNKYIQTFEQKSIGILHFSLDNKIIDTNEKSCELLGYTKEELLHKGISDLSYYEDIQKCISKINLLLLNKDTSSISFEKRYVKKDGSILWVNTTLSISYNKNDEAQYFIAFIKDISQEIDLKEQLIQSDKKFKHLYEEVPYPYQSLNEKGKITDINKKWLEVTGYSKYEVLGKSFDELVDNDEQYLDEVFETFKKNKKIHDVKFNFIKRDGSQIRISVDGNLSIVNGLFQTHCIFKDITKKEKIEKKLQLSDIVFENSTEAIMITNENNQIISVNKAFTNITQYTLEDVYGKNPNILQSGKHQSDFYINMWNNLQESGFFRGEIWNRKKDGSIYAEWLNISTVRNKKDELTNYVALFSDITKIKQSASKIEYLAHHDPLTDLPNRLLLNARLDKSLEKANLERHGLAVMFIDIDNFKFINDSYGHSFGDTIISIVANILKKNVRRNDTIARIGGDEFIIVIEDINKQNHIEKIAQKILDDFQEPIRVQEYLFEITVSIGISMYPNNGLDAEDLIKHADTAMYSAKNSGKNQYQLYKNQMTSDIFEKIIMKQEIKDAIDNKDFEVYYQPQIDIRTKRVIGAEALVRWNHQSLGLISPDNFIPHAEETKLIIPLGEYVLNEACSFMKKLQEEKLLENGKIAVNISAVQIKHSDIKKSILHSLHKAKLEPKYLEVEVTETFIMEDVETTLDIMHELKNLGIELSVDDFGTGYSSLSYLKQFPIDKLKIDKSFIDEIPKSSKDIAITKTIIELAKGLNLKTIAEGVEFKEQEKFLEEHFCDEMQGWIYSKALSKKEFIEFIKNY